MTHESRISRIGAAFAAGSFPEFKISDWRQRVVGFRIFDFTIPSWTINDSGMFIFELRDLQEGL